MITLARNVLLTGLPRSGSAAAGALIDYLPNTVCLNAPEWHLQTAHKLGRPHSFSKWLLGDFEWQRRLLIRGEPLPDFRMPDGAPIWDGLDPRFKNPPVHFTRPGLTPAFTLCMRHTTLFTALLPVVLDLDYFQVIAVIRNPVDVILSWLRNPKARVTPENPHGLGYLWPDAFHLVTDSALDEISRMAQLVELFFQRYYESRAHITIVKYEDIVVDPGLISRLFGVEGLTANATRLAARTHPRTAEEEGVIAAALKRHGACLKEFYSV